jgi:hypothetical protein
MRFIRGHNSFGMDRSGPRIKDRYRVEDRGYETPCWIWLLKTNKTGYGYDNIEGRQVLAHRRYYEDARGPIPAGLQLDHLCRQRLCVNPDHLEPVTPLENTRRSRSMKLTQAQAREIFRRACAGETYDALGVEFDVSRSLVGFIKRNGPDGPRNPGQTRKR